MSARIGRSSTRVKGFQDAEMDFQLIRQLGSTAYGGASVGECLSLAQRIENAIPGSWVSAFAELAQIIQTDARERETKKHTISMRDQYLRACNAWRAAEYYTNFLDPKHRDYGMKSRECFKKAMEGYDYDWEVLDIAFDGTMFPGYFFRSTGSSQKTIVMISGFDGTLEEMFLQNGKAALERGYNLVLMAGPGQMDTLRFHPALRFQPDYERPMAAVLDHIISRFKLNAERIGVLGISFGGYFTIRAASREPRIKALIANSPILDLHAYMASFMGFDPAKMPDEEDFTLSDIPMIPENEVNKQQKEMIANIIGRFGKSSFKETFQYMMQFRVGDKIAAVSCPCLALVGEGEGEEPQKQLEEFCENVTGPVTKRVFTITEGADSHCQVGNLALANAVIFDWLDENLK